MAKVLARIPNAQIKLIGDGADEQIKRLGEQFRGNVELHGFVPDISALFAESCALLVPLVAPGGLKLKMLTALYYGLPIIATDSGVDGIPLQEGVDFIKENKVTRFPLHMERLLNVDYNAEISRNAARAFERNYSKDKIFAEYDSLFCLRAAPDGDSASSPSSASSS